MGMFDLLKKAKNTFSEAKENLASDTLTRTEHEKEDWFDRTFNKIEDKLDAKFDAFTEELDLAVEAEQALYELADRIVASHRGVFTHQEIAMLDDYESLSESLQNIPISSRRYNYVEQDREEARNDLLISLAKNDALPKEVRSEITQKLEDYAAATPEAHEKFARFLSHLPMTGCHYISI